MSRLLVSFHAPGSPRDQVVYFRMGAGDEKLLADMLQERARVSFSRRKKNIEERIFIFIL